MGGMWQVGVSDMDDGGDRKGREAVITTNTLPLPPSQHHIQGGYPSRWPGQPGISHTVATLGTQL